MCGCPVKVNIALQCIQQSRLMSNYLGNNWRVLLILFLLVFPNITAFLSTVRQTPFPSK